MSHLETLIAEYYDWKGYLVKRNIKVGKLKRGGYEMELDIIAFHPHTKHLVHLEPSLDAHSWDVREKRFSKKFTSAKKYIFDEVFTWLDSERYHIEHIAILISHPKNRNKLAGAKLISVDECIQKIRNDVCASGIVAKNAISEQYPLLRTLQLSHNGYHKLL